MGRWLRIATLAAGMLAAGGIASAQSAFLQHNAPGVAP